MKNWLLSIGIAIGAVLVLISIILGTKVLVDNFGDIVIVVVISIIGISILTLIIKDALFGD